MSSTGCANSSRTPPEKINSLLLPRASANHTRAKTSPAPTNARPEIKSRRCRNAPPACGVDRQRQHTSPERLGSIPVPFIQIAGITQTHRRRFVTDIFGYLRPSPSAGLSTRYPQYPVAGVNQGARDDVSSRILFDHQRPPHTEQCGHLSTQYPRQFIPIAGITQGAQADVSSRIMFDHQRPSHSAGLSSKLQASHKTYRPAFRRESCLTITPEQRERPSTKRPAPSPPD